MSRARLRSCWWEARSLTMELTSDRTLLNVISLRWQKVGHSRVKHYIPSKVINVDFHGRLRRFGSELLENDGDGGKELGYAKGQTLVHFLVFSDFLCYGVMLCLVADNSAEMRTWTSTHIWLPSAVAPSNRSPTTGIGLKKFPRRERFLIAAVRRAMVGVGVRGQTMECSVDAREAYKQDQPLRLTAMSEDWPER
jgi:hypothetical protein